MRTASSTAFSTVFTRRTMAKKRKIPPELKEQWARTMRRLEERIAYHERKAAEEEKRAGSPPAP
jgi:hypothetical protein